MPSNRQISASTSSTELTKTSRGIVRQGLAVVEDLAAPGLVQPGGQPADRRLAASRAADQRDPLARAGDERELLDQRFLDRPVVAEGHLPELDLPAQPAAAGGALRSTLGAPAATRPWPTAKTGSIGRLRTSSMRSRSARSSWTSVPSRARSRNG